MQKTFGQVLILTATALLTSATLASEPAHTAFGATKNAAPLPAEAIGSYAKGCLAGGVELETDGPHWAAMRLKRERRWAHPALYSFIHELSAQAHRAGLKGLLIGDTGQARGGPMKSGHRSHQIGLDVDIWLRPMTTRPDAKERESLSSYDLVKGRSTLDAELLRKSAIRAIPLAAKHPDVARIFVNAAIKRQLCNAAPANDRAWLGKVRAWWGHDAHFHVRLSCPAGSTDCEDQAPVPAGEGCGKELDWWFTDEPYTPKTDAKPRKPLTLDDLPQRCRAVLAAR